MRSVIFRYGDIAGFSAALSDTSGSLPLPAGETVTDGEWVLAIFEIGSRRRATAAAARGVRAAGDTHLEFERRDWERLLGFVAARSEHMRAARPISNAPAASSSKIPIAKTSPALEERERGPMSSRRGVDVREAPPSTAPDSGFGEGPPSRRVPFGARVLVIDESRGGAGDELRAMLTDMGLVVELVTTTRVAEERMRAKTFDAIVLDVHGTGPESHGFVTRVRRDARVADIPVLLVSAKPTSRDVVDAFASGCDDFLPKPFRTPELAARIFGLLRRARTVRGAVGSSGR